MKKLKTYRAVCIHPRIVVVVSIPVGYAWAIWPVAFHAAVQASSKNNN
jgi:hypothetical protein